jgi:hypothetical protein
MKKNDSLEVLHQEFVLKLIKRYGPFSEEQFRFANARNTEIARDLNYSDAQFSRLLHKTATEGEYQRAVRNIDRILNEAKLLEEIGKLKSPGGALKLERISLGKKLLLVALGMLSAGCIFFLFTYYGQEAPDQYASQRDDMLRWSFETAFVSPYTKLDELPDDCNFPCYKYQGRWELEKPYKLPFFREQSGFHYLALEVNMYARCMPEKQEDGTLIEGYEYQKHEIWYDKRKLPIESFVNLEDNRELTPEYQNLDFSQDENFIKIANVHTFFKNEFIINADTIIRSGKVVGRDIEFVPNEVLKTSMLTEKEITDLSNDVNRIVFNRLEDFSKPIACETTFVPHPDFHKITKGDKLSFKCTLTTGRYSLNYEKTYILRDQYIENTCQ